MMTAAEEHDVRQDRQRDRVPLLRPDLDRSDSRRRRTCHAARLSPPGLRALAGAETANYSQTQKPVSTKHSSVSLRHQQFRYGHRQKRAESTCGSSPVPVPHARRARLNPHAVERTPDKHAPTRRETPPTARGSAPTRTGCKLHAQFHRQQPEQRRELDDRVHRHRRGVLERIADRVADDVAACSGVPFSFSSTSTIFFALSQAPPALAMKIAWNSPNSAIETR